MPTDNKAISVTYSDEKLRILVEEFITMQKHDFTFKSLCSYVLFWAKEERETAVMGQYESNQLEQKDCKRLSCVLEKIVKEGRVVVSFGHINESVCLFDDETVFEKKNK